jgi:uncharacterized repeat protein (TIGR03803 family)
MWPRSLLLYVAIILIFPLLAMGQAKEKILYSFGASSQDQEPTAGLVLDPAGNLYGITNGGGAYQQGSVFELSPSNGGWTESVLYSFCQMAGCPDGSFPYPGGGLILDNNGNLYGTAGGGAHGAGVVFELSPGSQGWSETVLYSFLGGNDGSAPQMPLVFDSAGNLYGTTVSGGAHTWGTAFKLMSSAGSWTETILYNFCSQPGCSDGQTPDSGLTFDSVGNLYGSTSTLVYQLALSNGNWADSIIFKQSRHAGGSFLGGLIYVGGNLYGTAEYGGTDNYGLVYELHNTVSGWKEFEYSFDGQDGANPVSGLLKDRAGNFDGVAGSTFSCGVVYSLARKNRTVNETILHNFTGGLDGCGPIGSLAQDSSGSLYGVTLQGGTYNEGVVPGDRRAPFD